MTSKWCKIPPGKCDSYTRMQQMIPLVLAFFLKITTEKQVPHNFFLNSLVISSPL